MHFVGLLMYVIVLSVPALGAELPSRALYQAALLVNAHPKMVSSVRIAVDAAGAKSCWYELTCTQVNGASFTFWFLAEGK